MRRLWLITALLALSVIPRLAAVQKPFQPGLILDVKQKIHERVLYYLVNTPITQADPYFEISVQLKNETCVGEYTPFHASETLPEEWKPDATVQVRIADKNVMYLKRPDGRELPFVIVKRQVSQPAQKVPEDAPEKK